MHPRVAYLPPPSLSLAAGGSGWAGTARMWSMNASMALRGWWFSSPVEGVGGTQPTCVGWVSFAHVAEVVGFKVHTCRVEGEAAAERDRSEFSGLLCTVLYMGTSHIRQRPPASDPRRTLCIGLLQGSTGEVSLMSEVPLYCTCMVPRGRRVCRERERERLRL